MEQILKRIKYILILCLIIAAFIGGRYSTHTDVVYQQDVKPATHTQTQSPEGQSYDTLFNWALEDIEIDREYNQATGELKIRAYTSYKESIVYDRIRPTTKKHFVFAGLGVDKDLTLLYTAGYCRQLYDLLYVGGYVSFNQTSLNSVNAIVGYSL